MGQLVDQPINDLRTLKHPAIEQDGIGNRYLGLAAHFFPRIVVLDKGRVVGDGHPADVLTDELIRDVFGVDPALVHRRAGSAREAGRP